MTHKGRDRLQSLPDIADVLIWQAQAPHLTLCITCNTIIYLKSYSQYTHTSLKLFKMFSFSPLLLSKLTLPLANFRQPSLSSSRSVCDCSLHCCNATWSVYQYCTSCQAEAETQQKNVLGGSESTLTANLKLSDCSTKGTWWSHEKEHLST